MFAMVELNMFILETEISRYTLYGTTFHFSYAYFIKTKGVVRRRHDGDASKLCCYLRQSMS